MFHWTERRVDSRVAICETAFAEVARSVHLVQPALSEDRLLVELDHLHVTKVLDPSTRKRT